MIKRRMQRAKIECPREKKRWFMMMYEYSPNRCHRRVTVDGLKGLRFPDGCLEVEDVVGIDLFLDGLKPLVVCGIVQRRGCRSNYSVTCTGKRHVCAQFFNMSSM